MQTRSHKGGLLLMFFFFVISNSLWAQCPGPNPCAPGSFNPSYEQIDPSNIAGAVFCSGQTRTFTINVGPGTTTEASTGDLEYVTLFFDFDCDGVFEFSVNDNCSYDRAAGGCSVDFDITAPTVGNATTFNGRAHLVYNTPTTDPCANLPGGWGDIEDFTITVNLPPAPDLSSSDGDDIICLGDNVTFTGTDGDEYEFYINGASVQAQSATATFSTTALTDGDQVTVRAINNASGCDTFSTALTYSVLDPSVVTQPTDNTTFDGQAATFSIATADVDTFQWQLSTDGGSNFVNLSDGTDYNGTQTANLQILSPSLLYNSYQYRVLYSHQVAGCPPMNSNSALLTVRVSAVLSNREITYRVNQ